MKPILVIILLFIKIQWSFGQVMPNKLGISHTERAEKLYNLYADSLNNYASGKLPGFLFDECFDWNGSLWPDMHSAISVRWKILQKVTNKEALNRILKTRDQRLKLICDHQEDHVYPFLSIPMIRKSFYQLIEDRYKQL